MPPITDKMIRHEADIIAQEGALRTATDKLAAAAWSAAYGDAGLDAFGNLDVIRTTTPAELSELHRRMFAGSNLVISIAGDVDLDDATKKAADILRVIPMGDLASDNPRPPATFSDVSLPGLGEARGAPAPGLLSPKLAWTLAAGLAVAAGIDNSFVTYTPTVRNGLVIVGQTGDGDLKQAFEEADAKRLVGLGRRLAADWVDRQLHDPAGDAAFRGMLLVQDAGLRPDTLLENLAAMQWDQFQEGLDAFRRAALPPSPPAAAHAFGGATFEAASEFASALRADPVDATPDMPLASRRDPSPATAALKEAEPAFRDRPDLPASRPQFLELPNPAYAELQVAAVVKLPPLDAHERAMLARIVRTLRLGPAEYGRRDLMAMTGGEPVRCDPMDDCLSLSFPASKDDLAGAVGALAEMLQRPRSGDSGTNENPQPPDPWESILHGPYAGPDSLKIRPGELDDFFHQIFRPDAVTVAVSGPFQPGAAQALWEQKTLGWKPPRVPRTWQTAAPDPPPEPMIAAVELDGPEIAADARDLPTSVLAMFALGCGKGASLFRVAREQDGLSYRQESLLWPAPGGWTPRLVVASAGLKDGAAVGEQLRKQLLDDVAAWTESDRQRAAGLAAGVLMDGCPLSPFYFQPDGPVVGSAGDRAFLEAYWMAKTGQPWNPEALTIRLKGVSLDALKAEATRLLKASQVRVEMEVGR